ncbi:MAG: hypothetical protein K6G28_01135 [Acholeplasmatales bacterium]|nr:hypothetical protein [Acholeplasmatales bacterium]
MYEFVYKLKTDYSFRSVIFGLGSLLTSVFMGILNLLLGIIKHADWNFAIAVFYFIFIILRFTVFLIEYLIKNKTEEEKKQIRYNTFLFYGLVLIILDLSLSYPISLTYYKEKSIYTNTIIAIAFAAYTTMRLAIAVTNLKKTHNIEKYSLSIRTLKIISFTQALVSLITFQNVMILTFGSYDHSLKIISIIFNGIVVAIILIITILMIRSGIKYRKIQKELSN